MDIKQEVEYLRSIPMLSKLDSSKLKLLAFTSRLVEYHDGEYLFQKGDPADAVYLIMRGQAEVVTEVVAQNSEQDPTLDSSAADVSPVAACAAEVKVVLVRREGELLGEMAVLSNQGRSAAVRARGDLSVLCMEGEMFVQLLASNSDVALDMMRQLSDKLTQAHESNSQMLQQLQVLTERCR